MNPSQTTVVKKGATLFFNNRSTGERLEDDHIEYGFSEVVRLLSPFTKPGVSLITTMPSGLGLDFHAEAGVLSGLSSTAMCFRALSWTWQRHGKF